MQSDGEALTRGSAFHSVADLWNHRVASTPDVDAMIRWVGGRWVSMDWREAGQRVRAIANGLLARGIQPEDRVAIVAGTRVEWILADFGILCAGAATTTIYPTSTPEECGYILNDCGAVAVFVDTAAQAAKVLSCRDSLPALRDVIVFDGGGGDGTLSLSELEAQGQAFALERPQAYDEASAAITPDRLATLIYTSGTTGEPKGVMLSHDAWVYEGESIDALRILSPADKQYLFLPLSHVFAKVLEILFVRLGIPTVVDGDVENLMANLADTQPTFLAAVPRVFEKSYDRIVNGAKDAGGVGYATFKWALDVGAQVSAARQAGKPLGTALRAKWVVADRLVFAKVRQRFGGRLRFFISGAAPLSRDIAAFFHAADVLILEGYGLTESSAATCFNRPEDFEFGTVGKPLPGTQVRIASDGEILLKGRGVMTGYYQRPELTSAALDGEGWLHTGDIGVITGKGHLKITDRKKEMLITAGGKTVAPAHFERLLVERCPFVSHVVVHGDRRPYIVALVALSEELAAKHARANKISYAGSHDLVAHPAFRAIVQAAIDEVNKGLPPFETVKHFAVVPEDFSVSNGMLTSSHKVKRRTVEDRYRDLLDGMYAPRGF